MNYKKKQAGFTLTEVLVSIAILAILMAMIVVLSNNYINTRKTIELRQNVSYELDNIYEEFSSNPNAFYSNVLQPSEVEGQRELRRDFKGVDNYFLLTCEKKQFPEGSEEGFEYILKIQVFINNEESFIDYDLTRRIVEVNA